MKVTLIGAGPGDAGLLTIKGLERLRAADVVLYDRLVGDEIIALIPERAEKINVGKCANNHPIPQHEISRILLDKARQGKNVVRLKGGDSFVFGRGGEELELLAEQGIPFEVIPGITSSIAAATYAGIPITHRDYASSFHVITGHVKENGSLDIDFDALVRTKGTLVFMMSVSTIGDICSGCVGAGMEKTMPAAIIENATTTMQRKFIATVDTIAQIAIENNVASPAVIIIGKVCALSQRLDWFSKLPLFGKNIVVTRAKASQSSLSAKLKELGANVVEIPSIRIVPLVADNTDLEAALSSIGVYSWLVFTSAVAVNIFFDYLIENRFDIRRLHRLKIAVVGAETAKEVEKRGLIVDYMPQDYNGAALANGLIQSLSQADKLLLLRAKIGSDDIVNILQASGFCVSDVSIYDTVFETEHATETIATIENGHVDYVTFTSSSTVEGFVRAAPTLAGRCSDIKCVCIGEKTAETAQKYGFTVSISEQATTDSMIEKIKELVAHE